MHYHRITFLSITAFASFFPSAFANPLETPSNGVIQMGRGSAWVARSEDPLAAYYNPAAMVDQKTGAYVGAHLIWLNQCFERLDLNGEPMSPGNGVPGPGQSGGPDLAVCNNVSPFPNPQAAVVLRAHRDFAIGLAVLGPHGVGTQSWPESIDYTNQFGIDTTQPSPQRYLLVESDSKVLFPTLSFAYRITPSWSIGAGFIWGIASIEYTAFAEGISPIAEDGQQPTDDYDKHMDVKPVISTQDLFIPGFILSAQWKANKYLTLGGWFKWQDAIDGSVDINIQSLYWNTAGTHNEDPCKTSDSDPSNDDPGGSSCNLTDQKDAGHFRLQIPMEAKWGLRFHQPLPHVISQEDNPIVDPLAQDQFDIELDFTWSNSSAMGTVETRFRDGMNVVGTPGLVPINADVTHGFRDVMSVHIGSDYNLIPNRLAIRAGSFYQASPGSDEYLNLDVIMSEQIGASAGATLRLGAFDISAGYQHTWVGTLDNGGQGRVYAISGDATSNFRTRQPVNGGRLETSLDEVALGATTRF